MTARRRYHVWCEGRGELVALDLSAERARIAAERCCSSGHAVLERSTGRIAELSAARGEP